MPGFSHRLHRAPRQSEQVGEFGGADAAWGQGAA